MIKDETEAKHTNSSFDPFQAMTKGIWIWKGDYFGDPGRALILLDTEGLCDPEKGDESHDMELFALSVLLSSVLVTIQRIQVRFI